MKTSQKWLISFSLLAVYLIWGSTYLAIRFAVETIPPFLMTGTRFLLAGSLLMGIMRWRGIPFPDKKLWLHTALIAALMLGGGTGMVAFAEQSVSSGLAAVLITTVPIWAAFYAGIFGQFPTRLEWLGIVVGLVGVILLYQEEGLQGNLLGTIAILFAASSWALGSVLSKQKLTLPAGGMGFGLQMLLGGMILVVFGVIIGERMPAHISTESMLAWLYLATIGSLVAFSAYMYLVETVPITVATSYAYVNPAVAVWLGVWLGGERISIAGIVGMFIILTGVAIIAYSQTRKK